MAKFDAEQRRDLGLLIARVGLGAMFMVHGWPKLIGGPDKWAKLGKAMGTLGIDFAPTFWGFCAAVAEFFGGLLLATGVAFVPAALALVFTMLVAALMHLEKGDGLKGASHAIEAGIVFAALALTGPGRYAVELRRRREG